MPLLFPCTKYTILFSVLVKSPSAIDYSDINEYVEDDTMLQKEDDGKLFFIWCVKVLLF